MSLYLVGSSSEQLSLFLVPHNGDHVRVCKGECVIVMKAIGACTSNA